LKVVLFVCIGNTCRSPMAEAFANHYGSDVLQAFSAGLAPTQGIAMPTVAVMKEKNIDVSRHVPELYEPDDAIRCDIVVNMSGFALPGPPPRNLIEWTVKDPYRLSPRVYRQVRDDLEQRVMRLILDLRAQSRRKVPA
jgi:arsenate reductase